MTQLVAPHISRRTLENIRKAGLRFVEERNVCSDWVKGVAAR
jgi:hypothetical protein